MIAYLLIYLAVGIVVTFVLHIAPDTDPFTPGEFVWCVLFWPLFLIGGLILWLLHNARTRD